MWARLRMLWVTARDSLWFIPAIMTFSATALALVLVQLERIGYLRAGSRDHWLLGGGAEGARAVLSAIAGGLITVTGVVFSVTIVALQLASSQFTPRVLRNFTADRSNQVVLGVFIGTFTYTLLVLRVVRSSSESDEAFIPRIAIGVAVILVLVSIGFLIYFINHAARSMQIAFILDQVTRRSIDQIRKMFPESLGQASEDVAEAPEIPDEPGFEMKAWRAGYLQAVDGDTLFDLGRREHLLIRMECRIGEFVLPGQTVATLWPAAAIDNPILQAVHAAFVLGPERTPEQDVEFGIIEISDIAVKALSPGINDPTTAFRCIDRLGEILSAVAARCPPQAPRTRQGRVHFYAMHTDFDRALALSFDQIRHFGSDNRAVIGKILEIVRILIATTPESRRESLRKLEAELQADLAGE